MLSLLWKFVILRSAEDEGGAGGGAGASDTGAADRNSLLEARVARMSEALDTLVSRDKNRDKQVRDSQASEAERRLEAAVRDADTTLDTAEKALAAAFDDGDGVTIAKAQRTLAEAAASRERIRVDVSTAREHLKAAARQQQTPSSDNLNTSNLDAWKGKHKDWYGVDDGLTQAAHDIHATLTKEGVLKVGSQEYFNAIDHRMRARFPDKFGGSPAGAAMTRGSGGGGGTGATPNSRRVPASIEEGWRRMGFDTSKPEVVTKLLASRQKAADKGLLPAEMPTSVARVFAR